MRAQKMILSMLILLALPSAPIAADALEVTVNGVLVGSGTSTVSLDAFSVGGFTITTCPGCTGPARAVAEQSGSTERIVIIEATITAPSMCSTASPCLITITATSEGPGETFVGDFPDAKPVGGYPSGVIMSGFFIGAGDPSFPDAPAGNSISVTGKANVLAVNEEFINVTPGPGDSPVSLPSAFTGNAAGRFTATAPGAESFSDVIAETIQLDCGGAAACPPSMSMSVAATFVNPGDTVDLPVGFAQAREPATGQSSAEPLIGPLTEVGVRIDVKPGTFPNTINLRSLGSIPVAIFSSPILDAPSQVIQSSLKFGPTGSEASPAFCGTTAKDVNGDGRLDLVCHFDTQLTGFHLGDTRGILKGELTAPGTAVPFMDTDSVRIIP